MKNSKLGFLLVPVAFLCFWQGVVYLKLASPLFVPEPSEVFLELVRSSSDPSMAGDVSHTLYRVIASFFIATIIGVPLGLLMGFSRRFYDTLEFSVEFVRGIPPTALFPLFLLIFGIGDGSKLAMTACGAGTAILIHSMYGVHLGKELRIRVAKTMKLRGFDLFRKVIFPEALPHIFSGFRVAISLSLILVIVTEMFIGTTAGIGKRIIDAQLVYETADIYAAIFVVGAMGFLLNKIMMMIERKVVHWKGV